MRVARRGTEPDPTHEWLDVGRAELDVPLEGVTGGGMRAVQSLPFTNYLAREKGRCIIEYDEVDAVLSNRAQQFAEQIDLSITTA
jgi:nitrous oxide reductase accessory protein NosL